MNIIIIKSTNKEKESIRGCEIKIVIAKVNSGAG